MPTADRWETGKRKLDFAVVTLGCIGGSPRFEAIPNAALEVESVFVRDLTRGSIVPVLQASVSNLLRNRVNEIAPNVPRTHHPFVPVTIDFCTLTGNAAALFLMTNVIIGYGASMWESLVYYA